MNPCMRHCGTLRVDVAFCFSALLGQLIISPSDINRVLGASRGILILKDVVIINVLIVFVVIIVVSVIIVVAIIIVIVI